MKKRDFDIVFSGLSLGEHHFDFELNDAFFTLFAFDDYNQLNGKATVLLNKQTTFLELDFSFDGTIEVICDRSAEPFSQTLNNAFSLLVKFGDEYNDEDDERLILPHGEYKLNVAQYLYELVVLSIPQKNIHPDVASGKKKTDFEVNEEPQNELENKTTDPRWEKLKDLLN